ncbi:WhiB family transcriptional regulator [Nocardioides pakistanensis]
MLPRDQEWTALAECAQVDPDLWHPEKGGNNEFAKKICERCPVKRECLDYVIAYEAGDFGTKQSYPTGIYGGLSAMERRPLIKAHRQDVLAATGTEAAVPIATATTVDEQPTVRQYGLPYVGGANGDTHYPLPNPDRVVHIEPRAHAKPSIDWDEIRRRHDERRRAEGTLDDQPATTVVQLRCRWCRQVADELTNDLCPGCVADAEAKFTAPDTTVLGQDLADLEAEDPKVAAAAASYNAMVDRIIHPEDHAHLEVTELPTEGKQGQPTTGSSAPGATATSSQSGRAPARTAGSSTTQEKDPEPTRETRPTVGSGLLDVPAYCEQLLRETANERGVLVQLLRNNALAALAALDLVVHPIDEQHTPLTPVAVPAPNPAADRPAAERLPDTATGTTGFQTFQKPRRRRSGSGAKGDEADIVRLYTEEQMSSGEIALQLHTTPKRVRAVLDRAGIERRDDRKTRSGGKPKDYPADLVADVRRLYVDQGKTQAEVAAQLDTTVKVVQNVMARHDISARPSAVESSKAGIGRPLKLDDQAVDQIVDRYQAGESATALARAFNVSAPSVLARLRQRGVTIRPRGGSRTNTTQENQ